MKITDEMCEAAVKAYHIDRIQGFTYKTHHVIRDVWADPGSQKVWEIDKNDADAEDKFYHQCRIERMRKVLEAALAVSSPDQKRDNPMVPWELNCQRDVCSAPECGCPAASSPICGSDK